MAQKRLKTNNNTTANQSLLSGGQKALIVLSLLALAVVLAIWGYVKYVYTKDAVTEAAVNASAQGSDGYLKMTKGTDIDESVFDNNINMDAHKGFDEPSVDEIDTTSVAESIDTLELKEQEDMARFDKILKEKKEELVSKSTDNLNWFYGTLTIDEDSAEDTLVIFDYTEFAETPAAVMLYYANEDRFYEPTYLNDDESGEVYFDLPSIKKGTYGIYIKEAYEGQEIGTYRVYTMPKEDYDNMKLFEDGILVDDELAPAE